MLTKLSAVTVCVDSAADNIPPLNSRSTSYSIQEKTFETDPYPKNIPSQNYLYPLQPVDCETGPFGKLHNSCL